MQQQYMYPVEHPWVGRFYLAVELTDAQHPPPSGASIDFSNSLAAYKQHPCEYGHPLTTRARDRPLEIGTVLQLETA